MGISIKNGHIFIDDETELDIAYVKSDMRKAVSATGRNSLYVQYARSWMSQLDSSGLRAIPEVQAKIRALTGLKDKGMSIGGSSKNIREDHRTHVIQNGDSSFLKSTFGITLNKNFKNKNTGKSFGLGTEILAKQYFVQWHEWLNMIKQFAGSKPKPKEDLNKKYADNFDTAFKEPTITKAA